MSFVGFREHPLEFIEIHLWERKFINFGLRIEKKLHILLLSVTAIKKPSLKYLLTSLRWSYVQKPSSTSSYFWVICGYGAKSASDRLTNNQKSAAIANASYNCSMFNSIFFIHSQSFAVLYWSFSFNNDKLLYFGFIICMFCGW